MDAIDKFDVTLKSNNTAAQRSVFRKTVGKIFGHGKNTGLGLEKIDTSMAPGQYDKIFKFLHPSGPLFKMCFQLCSVSTTYEFPVSSVPPLNPFEYYLFSFITYLITHKKSSEMNKFITVENGTAQCTSLYVKLCEEYIRYFIPCEEFTREISQSLRQPAFPQKRNLPVHSYIPINILKACSGTDNPSAVWRTYVFVLMTIDIWVGTPKFCITNLGQYYLPTCENVSVVCYLIKHIYFFVYSHSNPRMDAFRKEIFSILGEKIYIFIKTSIAHWPHDATFSILLDTWLTFIQPWVHVPPYSCLHPHDEYTQCRVDRKWMTFITDNFIFYTHIFQLMMLHLRNEDFLLARNAHMIIRPLRAYASTGLSEFIREIETHFLKESRRSIWSSWAENMFVHFCQHEGTTFEYTPVFGNSFSGDMFKLFKNLSSTSTTLRKWPSHNSNSEFKVLHDYEDDRLIILARLTEAVQLFRKLYRFFLPEGFRESSLIDSTRRRCFGGYSRAIPALHFKYTRDPELLPVHSDEFGTLVKFFFLLSTRINYYHLDEVSSLYNAGGYTGRFARQFIMGPMEVHHLDKSRGRYRYLTVSRELPPRISLRALARKKIYIFSFMFIISNMLFGSSFLNSLLYLIGMCLAYFLARPLILY